MTDIKRTGEKTEYTIGMNHPLCIIFVNHNE